MVRVHLTFDIPKGSRLPLNYQYPISAWIYKVIAKADADFATWLHDRGYQQDAKATQGKQYRLFTFSRLFVRPFKILEKESVLLNLGTTARLTVSFYGDEAVQKFVTGLFSDQTFWLGTPTLKAVPLKVKQVSIAPRIDFEQTQRFRAATPICLSVKNDKGKEVYLSPDAPNYLATLRNHLTQKIMTVGQHFPDILQKMDLGEGIQWQYDTQKRTKEKLITIKEHSPQATQVKGFVYDFELTAPQPIMELLYYAGLGKATSQGFGMVDVVE